MCSRHSVQSQENKPNELKLKRVGREASENTDKMAHTIPVVVFCNRSYLQCKLHTSLGFLLSIPFQKLKKASTNGTKNIINHLSNISTAKQKERTCRLLK